MNITESFRKDYIFERFTAELRGKIAIKISLIGADPVFIWNAFFAMKILPKLAGFFGYIL